MLDNNTKKNILENQTGLIKNLIAEVEKVFVGKRFVVELTITSLIAKGHLLLEDVPGVGKTTLAKALSKALDLEYSRIQFTSDMLPSDILGTFVFNPSTAEFSFRSGPIFSNIILADEINRSSPRTQSALLEAMNENQVTIDRETVMEIQKSNFNINLIQFKDQNFFSTIRNKLMWGKDVRN